MTERLRATEGSGTPTGTSAGSAGDAGMSTSSSGPGQSTGPAVDGGTAPGDHAGAGTHTAEGTGAAHAPEGSGPAGGTDVAIGRGPGSQSPPPGRDLPAVILAVIAAGVYSLFNVLQWRLLQSPSWDLGIFTQLAKAYASFSAPIVPIKGEGFNLLGDHFHPILVLLAPFYAIAPSGLTLLIVQSLLFALSAGVVAATASRLLGQRTGLLIGAAYAASWGLQSAIASQFHEIAFAVPLLALSLSGLLLERWRLAIIAGGLLVFVKEDLGATVLVLGLVLAWRRGAPVRPAELPRGPRPKLRIWLGSLHPSGLWLAFWGIAWMLLSVAVILPLLNPQGQFAYGDRLELSTIVSNPLLAIGLLVSPSEKMLTVLLLVLIGGVVWLRSPFALIAVPTLLWRFWSGLEFYWTTDWHYSAILMPVVFLGLVDVLIRARATRTESAPGRSRGSSFAASAPVAAVLVAVALFPQFALADLFKGDTWAGPAEERTAGAEAALEAVPDGATVATDISLMAYLVPDHAVYWLGNEGNPPADYIVIDRRANIWGGAAPEADSHGTQKFPGESYTLILDEGGYQVARRD